MRSVCSIAIAFLFVAGCKTTTAPNEVNFTKAINEYLASHGEVCTAIGIQFPVDIPIAQSGGIGSQLAVLGQAGLVHATDTTAVVPGMFDALRGSTPPQRVKRYELTEEGKKYFRTMPGTIGTTTGFCYGQKRVDSIEKWTKPEMLGGSSQTEVTYTYKIANLPAWAMRSDVVQAFPDIGAMVRGQSTVTQIAGLELTNNGWEVPGQ